MQACLSAGGVSVLKAGSGRDRNRSWGLRCVFGRAGQRNREWEGGRRRNPNALAQPNNIPIISDLPFIFLSLDMCSQNRLCMFMEPIATWTAYQPSAGYLCCPSHHDSIQHPMFWQACIGGVGDRIGICGQEGETRSSLG